MNSKDADALARMGLDLSAFEEGIAKSIALTEKLATSQAAATKSLQGIEKTSRSAAKGQEALAENTKKTSIAMEALTGFAKGFMASFSIGAIIGVAKSLAGFASSIKDASDQLDLTTDQFQEFSFAVEQSGGTQEDFVRGMTALKSKLEDVKNGNKEVLATFEKLGVFWHNIRDLSADEIFLKIADAIKEGGTSGEEFAALMDIVGSKVGIKLVNSLKLGSDGFKELGKSANKAGKDAIEMTEAAEDSWDGFWRSMKAAVINFTYEWSQAIKAWKNDWSSLPAAAKAIMFPASQVKDILTGDKAAMAQVAEEDARKATNEAERQKRKAQEAAGGSVTPPTKAGSTTIGTGTSRRGNFEPFDPAAEAISSSWAEQTTGVSEGDKQISGMKKQAFEMTAEKMREAALQGIMGGSDRAAAAMSEATSRGTMAHGTYGRDLSKAHSNIKGRAGEYAKDYVKSRSAEERAAAKDADMKVQTLTAMTIIIPNKS